MTDRWTPFPLLNYKARPYCFFPPPPHCMFVTGSLALSPVGMRIAWGEVCPHTGKEWDPPLPRASGGAPGSPPSGGQPHKRGPPAPTNSRSENGSKNPRRSSDDTNNYRQHGFNRLPPAGEDFSKWTVAQLREFLSVSIPRR